jgi:aminoglycoside phosphotransferase (APT) family kinase protein
MLTWLNSEEDLKKERQLVQKLIGPNKTSRIEFIDSGWTSRVYVVNRGQFVIKFPRSPEVKKEYAQERIILQLLKNTKMAVQLPRPCWINEDNDYLGYEGIIGREFTDPSKGVDIDTKREIGREVGYFLKCLHSVTFSGARATTLDDEIKQFQNVHRDSLMEIKRYLSDKELNRLSGLLEREMPAEVMRLGYDPALCHGDLGYWNIIVRDTGGIGVIDFGDIGYYDRSKDFIGLQDKEILDEALNSYGSDETLIQKVAIRQKVVYILDLPFFIGKKDNTGIKKTVMKIRDSL